MIDLRCRMCEADAERRKTETNTINKWSVCVYVCL